MNKPSLSIADVLFTLFFLVAILFMLVVNVSVWQSNAAAGAKSGHAAIPAPLVYLSIGFLASIAGVILKKRWGRILAIAMLAFIAISSILIIRLYFRRLTGQRVDLFVLTFYLLPLLISLGFLFYFNLRKVKELFKN